MEIDWSKYDQAYPTEAMKILAEERKREKLKEEDVAKYANITAKEYNKYENGEQDIVDAKFCVVIRICKILKIDPNKLL